MKPLSPKDIIGERRALLKEHLQVHQAMLQHKDKKDKGRKAKDDIEPQEVMETLRSMILDNIASLHHGHR